eukprot:11188468-Lingulodinium_polyedra.AAC.1
MTVPFVWKQNWEVLRVANMCVIEVCQVKDPLGNMLARLPTVDEWQAASSVRGRGRPSDRRRRPQCS